MTTSEMVKEVTRLSGRATKSRDPAYLRERIAQLKSVTREKAAKSGKVMAVYVPNGWPDILAGVCERAEKRSVSELVRDALLEYEAKHKLGDALARAADDGASRGWTKGGEP